MFVLLIFIIPMQKKSERDREKIGLHRVYGCVYSPQHMPLISLVLKTHISD